MARSGELDHLRRGAYATPLPEDLSSREMHRRMVLATLPQMHEGAVLSHGSAAELHGLPLWPAMTERIHVTRSRSGGARQRRLVQVHCAPLLPDEITEVAGLRVTTVARTVLDLARAGRFDQAVAVGDHALREGLDPDELARGLALAAHWPGVARARRVVNFLDARAESPGESVSRVRCHELRLPPPELQVLIAEGDLRARVDFCWKDRRTIGEFDGKVKYGRLLKPGEDAGEAVWREKLREDALRELGWQIVRWIWADLHRPEVIRDRLERAFARAAA